MRCDGWWRVWAIPAINTVAPATTSVSLSSIAWPKNAAPGWTGASSRASPARPESVADSAILVKPQTYYNLSGECVSAILGYYKIPAERLIVVHDEIDLDPRQIRLKRGGGDAGNRGVRSIAAALGTPEFVRVRVGIGRPAPGLEAKDHVLHKMGRRELEAFTASIERAAEAVEAVITSGLERAMNLYNQTA